MCGTCTIGKTRSLIYSTNEAIHSFRSKSFEKMLTVHLPKSLGHLLCKINAAASLSSSNAFLRRIKQATEVQKGSKVRDELANVYARQSYKITASPVHFRTAQRTQLSFALA